MAISGQKLNDSLYFKKGKKVIHCTTVSKERFQIEISDLKNVVQISLCLDFGLEKASRVLIEKAYKHFKLKLAFNYF